MGKTIEYQSLNCVVMTFDAALAKYNERAAKGIHVAIIDASCHGGEPGEYFVIPAEVKEDADDQSRQLED